MNIKKNDFSFEESLKYLDSLASRMAEDQEFQAFRAIDKGELPADKVVKVFCVAMNIRLTKKFSHHIEYYTEYVYMAALGQIVSIARSMDSLRSVEMQCDGSILAIFDTPMKKDVEDVINMSAQIRSINDVVLRKFRVPLGEQVVSIGVDYGPMTYMESTKLGCDSIYSGNVIKFAEMLAKVKEDSVNISEDIYVNLSEEMQNNLFQSVGMLGEVSYHHSPLINIRMRKWVLENQKR